MPVDMPPAVDPLLAVPPVVVPRLVVLLPVVCAIAEPGMIRAATAIDVRIRIVLSCLVEARSVSKRCMFQ